jgi:hypothetical protein
LIEPRQAVQRLEKLDISILPAVILGVLACVTFTGIAHILNYEIAAHIPPHCPAVHPIHRAIVSRYERRSAPRASLRFSRFSRSTTSIARRISARFVVPSAPARRFNPALRRNRFSIASAFYCMSKTSFT